MRLRPMHQRYGYTYYSKMTGPPDGCIPTLVQEWQQCTKIFGAHTAAAICVRLVDVSDYLAIHITTRS